MFDNEQLVYEHDYGVADFTPTSIAAPSHKPLVQPGFQFPFSIWQAMFGCYTVFFAAMLGLASGSGFALFMVVISVLYALMFFFTGSVLVRLPGTRDDSPLSRGEPLITWCGPMNRTSVFCQVLIVPIGIAFFGIAVMLVSRSV